MSEHFWKGFWIGVAQAAVLMLLPTLSFVAGYYVAIAKLFGVLLP